MKGVGDNSCGSATTTATTTRMRSTKSSTTTQAPLEQLPTTSKTKKATAVSSATSTASIPESYDSYSIPQLDAIAHPLEKLSPDYLRLRVVHENVLRVLLFVYYYFYCVYGTEYHFLGICVCMGSIMLNSSFFYYFLSDTSEGDAFKFKMWCRVLAAWNLVIHVIRIHFSNSSGYAVLSASAGCVYVGWFPGRPVDLVGSSLTIYLFCFTTFAQLHWKYGQTGPGIALSLAYFAFGHYLSDMNFSMLYKYKILRDCEKELEKALQVKSEFVSSVSHELRNPLLGISGSVELLQATKMTKEQQQHVETILSCSSILQSLIEDILHFSKMESKTYKVISKEFSLAQCLQTVHRIATAYAQQLNIFLQIDADDRIPDVLEGDPRMLQQLLLNIISNAVKASVEKDVVVVTVRLNRSSDVANRLVILEFSVKDHGPGIPAEKQHLLFQPFSQLNTIPDRKIPSTGLGLAICKKLVESINGDIRIETSTEVDNHGTTVSVIAPYKVSDKLGHNQSESQIADDKNLIQRMIQSKRYYLEAYKRCENDDAVSTPTSSDYISNNEIPSSQRIVKVAIAEDNMINKNVVIRLLKLFGFKVVISAGDGKELIDRLHLHRGTEQFPDVVITDYHMPKLNGDEVAKIIRDSYSETKVILLTGNAFIEDMGDLVHKVLLKPVKSSDLLDSINAVLNIAAQE